MKHLSNLPRLFKLVASSLGREVQIEEDTIGGCSLYAHRPSANPEGCHASRQGRRRDDEKEEEEEGPVCRLVRNRRVNSSERCTVGADIRPSKASRPCPQTFMRQPFGGWDAVVLQDHSLLPTVLQARTSMLFPAVSEFAAALRGQAKFERRSRPIIATYMTWSYLEGSATGGANGHCPRGVKRGCFPFGSLHQLVRGTSKAPCHAYDRKVHTVPCMTYALARAYAETLCHGADVMLPAGLAWLAARGAPAIPARCKAEIDDEYKDGAGRLRALDLPLKAKPADMKWNSSLLAQQLFRDRGPDYDSKYCSDSDCNVDHHASPLGMYLNALVVYAALFNATPLSAAIPNGQLVDGMVLPTVQPGYALAMQRIVAEVVLPHLGVWWK